MQLAFSIVFFFCQRKGENNLSFMSLVSMVFLILHLVFYMLQQWPVEMVQPHTTNHQLLNSVVPRT